MIKLESAHIEEVRGIRKTFAISQTAQAKAASSTQSSSG